MKAIVLAIVLLMVNFPVFGQPKDLSCSKDKDCPSGKDCSKSEKDCPSGKDKDNSSKDKGNPDKGTKDDHDHSKGDCNVVICTPSDGKCYPPGCVSPGEAFEINKYSSSNTTSGNKDTSATQKAGSKSGQDTQSNPKAETTSANEHGNDRGPTGNQKDSVSPSNDKTSNKAKDIAKTNSEGGGAIDVSSLSPVLREMQDLNDADDCGEIEDGIASCEICKVVTPVTQSESKRVILGKAGYYRLSLSEFHAKYSKKHVAPDVQFELEGLAFFKTKILILMIPDLIYINSAYRSKNHKLERVKKHPGTGSHCTKWAIDVRPGGIMNRERSDCRSPVLAFTNYDRQKTQAIVDAILKIDPKATIYFNDPKIKGVQYSRGHDDHIHITWSKDSVSSKCLAQEVDW